MQITINGGEDKIGKLIDHIPHKEAVLVKKAVREYDLPCAFAWGILFSGKSQIYISRLLTISRFDDIINLCKI